jgi:hypothetical protein
MSNFQVRRWVQLAIPTTRVRVLAMMCLVLTLAVLSASPSAEDMVFEGTLASIEGSAVVVTNGAMEQRFVTTATTRWNRTELAVGTKVRVRYVETDIHVALEILAI